MRVLVTAGNTQAPIDRVRALTNIFTGRTGAEIALCAYERGHSVALLTSRPEAVFESRAQGPPAGERWRIGRYVTFEDLASLFGQETADGGFDAIIHSAAVSDYLVEGVYAAAPGTCFDLLSKSWNGGPPALVDRRAGKVKSDEPELWLRLVRAPKLIDQVRGPWGFRGILVKFKLEVTVSDAELLRRAERSREQSGADLMVANTLEHARDWAYLGSESRVYRLINRPALGMAIVAAIEELHQERNHG